MSKLRPFSNSAEKTKKRVILVSIGIVVCLVLANIYFLVHQRPTISELVNKKRLAIHYRQQNVTEKKELKTYPQTMPTSRPQMPSIISGSMKGHIGLSQALASYRLEEEEQSKVISFLKKQIDLRRLQPNQRFDIHRDPISQKLTQFIFYLSKIERVIVDFKIKPAKVIHQKDELVVKRVGVGSSVRHSLEDAFSNLGESKRIFHKMLRLFSGSINWSTDVRPNDRFKMIVEKKYLKGEFYRYGKILAAEYHGEETGKKRLFIFERGNDKIGYFDQIGRSNKRLIVKSPLTYRRISSHFNHDRFHPVLHRVKAHYGVDYAAPTGTPVYAAGDGVILFARRSAPAGNMIKIQHKNRVISVYMHLWRFARGIKVGMNVKQWQLIGYVGATGRVTGAHLHFGIQVNGRYVDPLGFEVPKGALLDPAERKLFYKTIEPLEKALDAIVISEPKVLDKKNDEQKHDDQSDAEDLWS